MTDEGKSRGTTGTIPLPTDKAGVQQNDLQICECGAKENRGFHDWSLWPGSNTSGFA